MIHTEKHLKNSDFITDMVIGMSDGLTVPFALAAGLSGAVSNNSIWHSSATYSGPFFTIGEYQHRFVQHALKNENRASSSTPRRVSVPAIHPCP